MPDGHAHQLLDVLDIVDAWSADGLSRRDRPGDPDVVALLGVAGFLAGWVDAVVGGGGLIQLPALLLGLPGAAPAQVLATNKFASVCGHRDQLPAPTTGGCGPTCARRCRWRRWPTSGRWWAR